MTLGDILLIIFILALGAIVIKLLGFYYRVLAQGIGAVVNLIRGKK